MFFKGFNELIDSEFSNGEKTFNKATRTSLTKIISFWLFVKISGAIAIFQES